MSRNYNTPVKNKRWGYQWPNLSIDYARDMEYIKEWSEQHLPIIPYYSLSTVQDALDAVHQEIEEHLKTWSEPVDLHTFVNLNPTEKDLNRYGIDEKRDIVLIPSVVKLVDVGLATLSNPRSPVSSPVILVKPGDKFVFDDKEFEVRDFHREKYHGVSNLPVYIAITGQILRDLSQGLPSPVTCE